MFMSTRKEQADSNMRILKRVSRFRGSQGYEHEDDWFLGDG